MLVFAFIFQDSTLREISCIEYDSEEIILLEPTFDVVVVQDSMTPDKDPGDHLITSNGNANSNIKRDKVGQFTIQCEEGPSIVAYILTLGSLLLVLASMPLSLMFVVKVVQEYERAVIFRLGRLLSGGARGPGVFFVIPCVDVYEKVDLRTNTYEIPPQEVSGEEMKNNKTFS